MNASKSFHLSKKKGVTYSGHSEKKEKKKRSQSPQLDPGARQQIPRVRSNSVIGKLLFLDALRGKCIAQ